MGNWLLLFWDLGNWDFPGNGISAFQFPGIGNLHFEFSGILGIDSFWDRDFAIIVSRDWDYSIFLDSEVEKIAELPGAAAPGPHHCARILNRGMKADRCLQ